MMALLILFIGLSIAWSIIVWLIVIYKIVDRKNAEQGILIALTGILSSIFTVVFFLCLADLYREWGELLNSTGKWWTILVAAASFGWAEFIKQMIRAFNSRKNINRLQVMIAVNVFILLALILAVIMLIFSPGRNVEEDSILLNLIAPFFHTTSSFM